jgi:hypothetical protein
VKYSLRRFEPIEGETVLNWPHATEEELCFIGAEGE